MKTRVALCLAGVMGALTGAGRAPTLAVTGKGLRGGRVRQAAEGTVARCDGVALPIAHHSLRGRTCGDIEEAEG